MIKHLTCLSSLIFLALSSTVAIASDLTFYVTDFGINQYKDSVFKTGSDFGQAYSSVFPTQSKDSQILIVMPPHEKMNEISYQQIKEKILTALKKRVDYGISKNVVTFELQIIEHIGTATYGNRKHQSAVNLFGKCAYEAIGELHIYLKDKGEQNIVFHGVFGSNGTKVFSENVNAWKSYMNDATFFDGRAFKTAMIETIKSIGAKNTRIFNTAGDYPAPNFPWIHSIGNHDVGKALKKQFPSLTVGWIDPLDRVDFIGKGHLAAMKSDHEARFLVKFWKGDSYTEPMKISGAQLLPQVGVRMGTVSAVRQESGVSMQMDLKKGSVKNDASETLDTLMNSVLESRPHKGSLSWSDMKKEEERK